MKKFFPLKGRKKIPADPMRKQGITCRRLLRRKVGRPFLSRGRGGAGKRRGVNIKEVFDAFDQVPDAGAVFSLRLCVALPVDGDPGASMNFSGGLKAGHTFLIVGKVCAEQRVFRSFGFYPAGRLSVWAPLDPYPSVIRDNRRHLAHGWLEMPMTALDFEVVRVLAITGAWNVYRLLSFNCAGYALAVFNSVREAPVELPPYAVTWWGIPIGYNRLPSRKQIIIPHTPQGLYQVIRALSMAGVPGAFVTTDKVYGLT